MHNKVKPFLAILVFFFSTITVFSQDFRIKNYGVREGIAHPFVYTINQDTRGYIWIGTGEGLCRFNGFEFNTDIIQDSLAREIAGISYKDSKGTLWFGYYSGDIAKYNGKLFESVNPGIDLNSAITGFAELNKDNLMFATLNNGLYIYNTASGKATKTEGIEEGMFTALYVQQNTILLGSQDGLAIYSLNNDGNKAELITKVSEIEYVKVQDIQPSVDGKAFWIATEDQGAYRLAINDNQYTVVKIGEEFKLGNENFQSVFEDSEGQLWLSTLRNGVYMLSSPDGKSKYNSITTFNKTNGLPGNSVKRVFEDVEGNIWIATYGDGISLLSGQPFSFRNYQNTGLENDIQSITAINKDAIYIGGPEGLFRVIKGKEETAVKINCIPGDRITALHADKQNLLVGTENNGLFVLNIVSSAVRKVVYEANSLGNSISSIATDSKYIYLGTRDGIYLLDKEFHKKNHFTTSEGLPHNNIEYVFIDNQNRLLFATRTNGIYYLNEKEDKVINLYPAGDSEIEFKSIAEDAKGGIWAATYGDGVYCFKNDSVYHLTVSSGLKANYCYSIVSGKDQSIWVGHRIGISRINAANLRVSVYDMNNIDMTGDCNLNAIYKDDSGIISFGTTEGIVIYDPSKDKKRKLPPFTNITRLLISDKPYDADQEIVLPYKLYKLRIEFIGLNYSDPQSVRYQYMLQGHDLEWSDITTQTYISYPRIEDGDYVFKLKSFNSEGLTQETPVNIHIRVKLPVWKTWWFISLSVITLLFSIYLYIKIRERKQKLLQEYLERELVARTKEVVEQKEVIEIKNRDITDSINYAKRIQTSMLPPIKRLQQHFSGCFVFNNPRDIVSGDFYWFDQVNSNKFVIICADSTGHGVPGAFMSMIGSTLIKDICSRTEVNSPSQVLQVLDNELRNTLNQNLLDDGTKPSDGIDIIVCEIDLKTHYVRYASAMRPMIIYSNGEEIFVKGSRNSVGGQYEREVNVFEDEGMQLGKGDIIYMFSDGYSDQFGGPLGKKFKLVRLKNLLQEIHNKPMDEQFLHVKDSFHQWKENYDQVDDVLFMGIKI
jgi:ligand-binding sensor domain-containing protein/serine phosphatase RsbU (regulator of sigma subunit)